MTLPRPADASTALSQQRSPPAVPSQRSQRRFLVISNGQNTAAGWVLRWLQDGHILGLIATEELPTHLYEQFLFIYDINDRLTLAEGLAGCRHVPLEGFLGRVRPQEIRVLLGESGDDKPRLHVADEMECLVRVFETLYKDDHLRDIPVYMYVKESYNTDDKQHKLPNDTQTDLLYAKLLELVSKPYAGVRNLRIYFRTFWLLRSIDLSSVRDVTVVDRHRCQSSHLWWKPGASQYKNTVLPVPC